VQPGSPLLVEQARLKQPLTSVKVVAAHSQRFHAIHALCVVIRVDSPKGLCYFEGVSRVNILWERDEEEADMVSTVTSTTVTTVTLFGITALLGIAAVLMLISYLVVKEMLSASASQRLQLVSQRLNAAIVPLLLVFAALVGSKVADVLG